MPSFPEDDEENLLYTNNAIPTNYGCITSSPLSHPQRAARSTEDSSSRGSSDVDDTYSNKSSRIAKRKQKRLEQRHRPKLSSRLSTVLRATSSDSVTGHTLEDTPELVLPALDPKAQEVIESTSHRHSLDQWFSKKNDVNLSTIRSKYRNCRKHARDENIDVPFIQRAKCYLKYDERISALRQFLLSNRNIIIFVSSDETCNI
ncbi:hypothetical protein BC941DRAFT_252376 [Chlamydoabsidia padenii]|nr:hypothetical protein BC941DRAFT_252376 [Chlamydoabsidia padenii]